ncbi:hypothetical protein HOLleu_43502 [Holothuria leucospilota]|uniref:Uncharacterized protein n=1 Tax=Holothuria leucospilota TaxID=206669 RepID=A0A9Q1B9P6_HOLLE|nr:hypothetical protein HOLleu_43502 [Holothuria leucospilota]
MQHLHSTVPVIKNSLHQTEGENTTTGTWPFKELVFNSLFCVRERTSISDIPKCITVRGKTADINRRNGCKNNNLSSRVHDDHVANQLSVPPKGKGVEFGNYDHRHSQGIWIPSTTLTMTLQFVPVWYIEVKLWTSKYKIVVHLYTTVLHYCHICNMG